MRKDSNLLALKTEEGAASQGMWADLKAGKDKEKDSPLELPEEHSSADTLILVP